jgi:hypothetical protein
LLLGRQKDIAAMDSFLYALSILAIGVIFPIIAVTTPGTRILGAALFFGIPVYVIFSRDIASAIFGYTIANKIFPRPSDLDVLFLGNMFAAAMAAGMDVTGAKKSIEEDPSRGILYCGVLGCMCISFIIPHTHGFIVHVLLFGFLGMLAGALFRRSSHEK